MIDSGFIMIMQFLKILDEVVNALRVKELELLSDGKWRSNL